MIYEELYGDYLKSAEILKNYIKNLKKNRKLQKGGNNNKRFYYRVTVLYSMYLDLKHISNILLEKSQKIEEEDNSNA